MEENKISAEEVLNYVASHAWKAAANAFRLYPDNKHTFADYWADSGKAYAAQFKQQSAVKWTDSDVWNMISMCCDQLEQPFEGRNNFINRLINAYAGRQSQEQGKPVLSDDSEMWHPQYYPASQPQSSLTDEDIENLVIPCLNKGDGIEQHYFGMGYTTGYETGFKAALTNRQQEELSAANEENQRLAQQLKIEELDNEQLNTEKYQALKKLADANSENQRLKERIESFVGWAFEEIEYADIPAELTHDFITSLKIRLENLSTTI